MDIRKKVLLFIVFFAIFFVFIIYRIVYIGYFAPYRERLAYAKTDWVTFDRGPILDRNGNPMAVSIRQTSIALDPAKVQRTRLNDYIPLCNILGMDFNEFKRMAERDTRFVWLKRKVEDPVAEKIRRLGLDGIQFVPEFNRFYPNKNLASHVLGCVGVDNTGLEGIELLFNNELKGSLGDEAFQRPETRHDRFSQTIEGRQVVLTIDRFIQHSVEKELRAVYTRVKPESASAIVMDPMTGEILAMANLPDFDPNNVRLYSPRSLKNTSVAAFYEPGSVFKIVTAAALMKSGRYDLKESYDCDGSIKIGNRSIKCWKKHGRLTGEEILKHSCNVGIIRLALRMDAEEFYNAVRSFGFGSLTGIEMPGEVRGLLRLPHQWGIFSKGAVAIGQEVGVTPLQMITACVAVANGGNLLQPRIIREVRYPNGVTARRYDPLVIRRVIASNMAGVLSSLLVRVTEKGGTGERAGLPRYDVAGKTGTAQIFNNAAGSYYRDQYVLSFLGYYPVDDPQVIMLIVLRKPAGGGSDLTGGTLAAPVLRSIAVAINSYRNIIPRKNVIPLGTARYEPAPAARATYSLDALPDFTGYNMKQCGTILNNLGLKANLVGSGLAFRQSPPPGSKIEKSVPVTVWFRDAEP